MASGKKNSLPVFTGETPRKALTVDDARVGLGGRTQSTGEVGYAVALASGTIGVVVFASNDSIDVCAKEGRYHRVATANVTRYDGELSSELQNISTDARIYATLDEQTRVRFQDSRNGVREGLLVEKCRYGALVLDDEKKILAVGFRRLWPLP